MITVRNMHINVGILLLLAAICVGCDYGRSGYYSLSFEPARVGDSTAQNSDSREQLVKSIRSTLKEQGFKESGRTNLAWNKGGAHVALEPGASGDLTLKVWAFGGKAALKDSQQVELELLRLITFRPDIRLVRVEPPRRTLD